MVISLIIVGVVYASITSNLYPISDGTHTDWYPSASSTHYTMVNNFDCASSTDYVFTTTTDAQDSYNISLSSIPDGSHITDIEVTVCGATLNPDSNGTSTLKIFRYWNGDKVGNENLINLPPDTEPLELGTVSWNDRWLLKTPSSTMEVGFRNLVENGYGKRIDSIKTIIFYQEP